MLRQQKATKQSGLANSAVRLRIEKKIYELQAIRVNDDKTQVLLIYNSKYDLEANRDFPNAILYRLETR